MGGSTVGGDGGGRWGGGGGGHVGTLLQFHCDSLELCSALQPAARRGLAASRHAVRALGSSAHRSEAVVGAPSVEHLLRPINMHGPERRWRCLQLACAASKMRPWRLAKRDPVPGRGKQTRERSPTDNLDMGKSGIQKKLVAAILSPGGGSKLDRALGETAMLSPPCSYSLSPSHPPPSFLPRPQVVGNKPPPRGGAATKGCDERYGTRGAPREIRHSRRSHRAARGLFWH